MAVWMIFIQLCWVAIAARHRIRDPRDGSVPVLRLSTASQGLLLPLPRLLFFCGLPGVGTGPRTPIWLQPGTEAEAPDSFEILFDGLAASAEALGGHKRLWAAVVVMMVFVLSVVPVVVMALAARGALIGDPSGFPDALGAFGAYVVCVAALYSARLHTRSSVVWALLVPLSGLILSGAWILGCLSGPVPPQEPKDRLDIDPAQGLR